MDVLSKKCKGAAAKTLSLHRASPEDVPGPHAGVPRTSTVFNQGGRARWSSRGWFAGLILGWYAGFSVTCETAD